MTVLLFTGFYLPGFKGGGPIRTIANMVDALGDDIDFRLVTLDHDLGDNTPYVTVTPDAWQQVGKAQAFYISPANFFSKAFKVINGFEGKILHLNSFFSFRFSIFPLLLAHWIKPRLVVVIGPRGEFSEGALALRSAKKRIYLVMARMLGLYGRVIWHASTAREADDIRRVMGNKACIRVAVDIACPAPDWAPQQRLTNAPLRLLFVSRISPMKNLLGAIQMLQQVLCPVEFNVYGPTEDSAYWASCQAAAGQLPAHVQFNYGGALSPAQVPEVMARHDLFYLPTLGENFGHVIAEALGCGLPVLVADTTPWRRLERQKLGWDIPLDQPDHFVAAIEACSRMPAAEYDAWRQSIRAWALVHIGNDEAVEQNRQLFMNLDITHEH